jgi:hypothetical protein
MLCAAIQWELRADARIGGRGARLMPLSEARSHVNALNRCYPHIVHWAAVAERPITPPTSPR